MNHHTRHQIFQIFRWIAWCVVCVSIGWMVSCGPNIRTCRDHGDCLAQEVCNWRNSVCVPQCNEDGDCLGGERCHAAFKVCVSECNEETDCLAGERCEPKEKVCVKTPCPSGRLQTNGKCPCIGQKDCTADTYCDSVGKTEGMCQAICPISGETPKEGKCPCPAGLVWLGWTCVPECPKTMVRRPDGICVPDLATLMPTAWEKIADGEFRIKCPNSPYWKRDEKGQCKLELPEAPIVSLVPEGAEGKGPPSEEELRKKLGPQKPCPADATDKWDEDYLKRENLPSSTAMVYVDASAPQGGDGSKQRPLRSLQEGVNQIAEGGVVLVAPGSYAWGLRITKRLHLVGRCTDGVKIIPVAESSGAGIGVTGYGATLEGFSVLGMEKAIGSGISMQQSDISTLQHLRVNQTHDIGISVTGGAIVMKFLEISRITRASYGRGIQLNSLTAKAIIQYNHVHDNKETGLFIDGGQDIEIEKNVFFENGVVGAKGKGIEIKTTRGNILLRHNHISKNAEAGIFMIRSKNIIIEGNLFSENGMENSKGKGIEIHTTQGKTTLRYNKIIYNFAVGIFINQSQDIEIESNLVWENGRQSQSTGGISLSEIQGKSVLRYNSIFQNTKVGIIIVKIKDIEIESNVIANNGVFSSDGKGILLQQLQNHSIFKHNHILKNTYTGLIITSGQYTTIEGNLSEENGASQNNGSGIALINLQEKAIVRHNHILKNTETGLFIGNSRAVEVEKNLLAQNGRQHDKGTGIGLQYPDGTTKILNNAFLLHPTGGYVEQLYPGAEIELRENWWSHNSHVGLELQRNEGKISLQSERFFRNGNTHLRVLSNRSILQVQEAQFIGGLFSKGIAKNGLGWSAGMGIWAGSLGLVRWVFAKDADYPCSLNQKKQVAPLSDGWMRKPVRIPYEVDPCQVWGRFQTDEERKQAGLCAKTCGKRKCRWVWSDVGKGNRGLWEPNRLECVDSNVPDTCETTISPHVSLQPIDTEFFITGQCIKLTSQEDPCNSPEMKECNQRKDSSGNRVTFCEREQLNIDQPIQAFCSLLNSPNRFCRPALLLGEQEPCESGLICISQMRVSLPMDVFPSRLSLEKSVFWGNPGPDVMMDMAGDVRLTDNQYHLCLPSTKHPNCALKVGYQSCVPSPEDPKCEASTDGKRGYKKFQLPAGATIVWQNPSPYDAPYGSKLQGNDLDRTFTGQALFYKPNTCEELSTQ